MTGQGKGVGPRLLPLGAWARVPSPWGSHVLHVFVSWQKEEGPEREAGQVVEEGT